MKKLSYYALLLATIVIGVFLGYSLWTQPRSSQDFFSSGKTYYEEKKYPEAIIQLQNAVQMNPRDREARYLLARSYSAQQDLISAARQFQAILEDNPDDVRVNLELGSIYLASGNANADLFRQAQEIAQKILAKEPQNVEALLLSGNASAGLRDYRSSIEQFEKARSLDPQNPAIFLNIATTQALQKNYAEAEQAFLKARTVSPKDKGVLISLGNYYRATRETQKAEAVFREALSLYPADKDIYVPTIQFFYQSNRFDEVEKTIRAAQAGNTSDPTPSLMLADLYVASNRPAEARKLLLELKTTFPGNLDVTGKLAANLLFDQPDQARTEIDAILSQDPNNAMGRLMLGQLQYNAGKYDEAEQTLTPITSRYPQPHYILGNIAKRKGILDEAQYHFQKSLDVDGRYVSARVALAELFLNKGRFSDSREEIGKVLAAQPENVPARVVKAALDTAEKNPAAESALNTLLKEQSENAIVHRQMGVFLESRGRTTEAEKSYLRALQLQPNSREILQGLVQLYTKAKQYDRAIQSINNVPDDKKEAFHHELLGVVYSQAGKLQDAETEYRKAVDKDPSQASTHVYLTAQFLQTGRLDEGLKQLDELIRANPSNSSAYAAKGLIYRSQGKLEQAKQSYNQALQVDPNDGPAANDLAYMLVEEGRDFNAALHWAQIARKMRPTDPNVADTLGWVYYKLGNSVLALDQLRFAASKQPANGGVQYHLAMAYRKNNQLKEAKDALKKALGAPSSFPEKPLAETALKEIEKLQP